MADEISIAAFLKAAKGTLAEEWALGRLTDDMAGTDYVKKTQIVAIAATEEALDIGGITTPGWCLIRNNSTTTGEIMHIREGTGESNMVQLDIGGMFALFKFSSTATAPYIISAAGTPEIEYILFEA